MSIANICITKDSPIAFGSQKVILPASDSKSKQKYAIAKPIYEDESPEEMNKELKREYELFRKIYPKYCHGFINYEGKNGKPRAYFIQTLFSETLDHRIKKISPKLPLLKCLAKLLQRLQSQKIVHNDLKPENLMFHGKKVVLIDFGLACYETENCFEGADAYKAPEKFRKEEVSYPADVWSMGLIFHEILHGDNPQDQLYSVCARTRSCFSTAMKELSENWLPESTTPLLHEMLHTDPKKRPAPEQILDRLNQFSDKI